MTAKGETRSKALLDGYNRCLVAGNPNLVRVAVRLIKGFKAEQHRARKGQLRTAEGFNFLETLQIWGDEVRHSMMLAWFLDRDATHAQGSLGFKLLLKHFGLDDEYAKAKYQVVRERHGTESRIDVEVAARDKFILHIENKIFSAEGENQTKRQWKDLLRHAGRLNVRDDKNIHGLYLTVDGHKPQCPKFRAISWSEIANVMDKFAESAKAAQVRLFATHYAQALRKMTFESTKPYENKIEDRPQT